jgi:hypothetical protein
MQAFDFVVNRRTNVTGRFPDKTTCLPLVLAVLDRPMTHKGNGIRLKRLAPNRRLVTDAQKVEDAKGLCDSVSPT